MKFEVKTAKKTLIFKAQNEFSLRVKLRKLGIKALQITAVEEKSLDFTSKIKANLLILALKELSLLLEAGISLNEALKELSQNHSQKNLNLACEKILQNLKHGQSPSQAFKNSILKLDESELALIKMGENSANLAFAFAKISELKEKRLSNLKRFYKAMNYPLFVFFALIVAFVSMMFLVIPQFKMIFEDFGINLPLLTRILLQSFDFLERYLVILLLFLLSLALFLWVFYQKNASFAFFIHQICLKMPFFGKMIFYTQTSNFFLIFSLLLRSGVHTSKALELANSSYKNKFLEQKSALILKFSKQGFELNQAFENTHLFENSVISMIGVGLKSAKLDLMCEKIADFYELKQNELMEKFLAMIEPLMTLFVAVLVLFLALGIFTPMWQLNSGVNF